jgi:solute carrier family 31 (copper transporter), member 1
MFAGSCIGIIFLVLSLEFLRRLGKEYDRFLARRYGQRKTYQIRNSDASEEPPNGRSSAADPKQNPRRHIQAAFSHRAEEHSAGSWKDRLVSRPEKPSIKQQLVRALLHMLQLGVAYFIMLLAMSYNGYIIICILIGAFLGAFIFSWDTIGIEQTPQDDPTVCCG